MLTIENQDCEDDSHTEHSAFREIVNQFKGSMAKPLNRTYSRYSLDAISLLGHMIRAGRLERKITAGELTSRIGISRSLLQRIEEGDPGCGIGAAFEAAAIAGVPLFETDQERMSAHRAALGQVLTLLPKTARKPSRPIKDDF